MTSEVSVQERLYPDLACFGCGPANERGLRLRSYVEGDAVIARFTPWPEHDNGLGFLNGGIIATVMDCHSGAAVLNEADRRGWTAAATVPLPYVSAALEIRYLRPTPLDATLELRATVGAATESRIVAEVELIHDGKTRAAATAHWARWRPRPPAQPTA
jgi:acyl-coenzyme A thioesterase PaaI-like protein